MINSPPYPIAPTAAPHYIKKKMLTVSGEETVQAAPDQAVITIGATTENKDPARAQQDNAEIISRVINLIKALSIPESQMKTVEYRIDPQYDHPEGTQIFKGYKVTHLIQITTSDIGQVGEIVDTAVKNGANTVSSVRFTVSNQKAYYNRALSYALENARQKAVSMAKTLGVTLNDKPEQVQETSIGQPLPFQIDAYSKIAAAYTPIQPGELNISAAVKVEYSYT
ncbi:SIMPL domain-containing protein [Bacillus sp. V5-8f]|uniref:SIMPL domain-containing protein n=1 Tax=Bacillus sp. V5-8f TaxID=2053044 RepID=UPI000C78DCA4|nr:SIMPL domain-containing protein [Bacillus sp. V5-8f]PLT35967.1 SIMPL domain-containing protein [Bacillus sp. V5-8f]